MKNVDQGRNQIKFPFYSIRGCVPFDTQPLIFKTLIL